MLLALAAACGGSGANLPAGTYISEITQEDLNSPVDSDFLGVQELRLLENGRFGWGLQTDAVKTEDGLYSVSGGRFTIEDEKGGCANLGQNYAKGTYKYSFDGKQVSFSVVQDNCGPRVFIFTKHAWQRQ
jgi:hypothetical protein